MKHWTIRHLAALAVTGAVLSGAAVLAGDEGSGPEASLVTITLAVEGMVCTACPYMVRKTLEDVPGVRAVEVSGETDRAIVTMDASVVDPSALVGATKDIGFPSRIVETAEP